MCSRRSSPQVWRAEAMHRRRIPARGTAATSALTSGGLDPIRNTTYEPNPSPARSSSCLARFFRLSVSETTRSSPAHAGRGRPRPRPADRRGRRETRAGRGSDRGVVAPLLEDRDDPLEPDGEAAGRDVLAEQPADHPVVAAAAGDRPTRSRRRPPRRSGPCSTPCPEPAWDRTRRRSARRPPARRPAESRGGSRRPRPSSARPASSRSRLADEPSRRQDEGEQLRESRPHRGRPRAARARPLRGRSCRACRA